VSAVQPIGGRFDARPETHGFDPFTLFPSKKDGMLIISNVGMLLICHIPDDSLFSVRHGLLMAREALQELMRCK
jgi:hypothetical protein